MKMDVDVDVYVTTTVVVVMAEDSLLALGVAFGDQAVSRVSNGALGMRGSEDGRGLGLGAGVGPSLVDGMGSWSAVAGSARMRGSEDVRGLGLDAGVLGSSRVDGVGSWSAVMAPSRILKLPRVAFEDVLDVVGAIAASPSWDWSCWLAQSAIEFGRV